LNLGGIPATHFSATEPYLISKVLAILQNTYAYLKPKVPAIINAVEIMCCRFATHRHEKTEYTLR
jgi:hypothetical protein